MNELGHLKRLSSVKTNAGAKFLTPAAFPGNHCPLHTTLALSAKVRGMSTLVVGTPECGTYSRNVIRRSRNKEGGLHWMYILDAQEVVFGCREGLIQALREMDQAGAKAIMMILTCVPELIGEDAEGIMHELQPQIGARLAYVAMGHFKCNSYPSGFWKTLAAFGSLMEPAKSASAQTVNVLGRSPDEDHIPMPSLLAELERKGFRLRMLAPGSDFADFEAAPDARLNLVLSPYMNPLAKQMSEQLGIPYVSLHEKYDPAGIDGLLDQIADLLGFRWEGEFAAAREQVLTLQDQVRQTMGGASYIIGRIGALTPLPLAGYLDLLGMKPLLLHMEEFFPDDRVWAKDLLARGHDPLICHMVNEPADIPVLKRFRPDFFFGKPLQPGEDLPGLAYMFDLYGRAGHERTALLLSNLLRALEHSEAPAEGRRRHGTI
ncbi:MAG: nitrogenase molybdenum-iron protein [Paenibacillaceae bacterium]|jgi:nitrogenase molybdenum-iron protein alpha/beta subunit|nr:nitrogenase molybdenum-iron protein [Paenibacillaceae bacterium]